MHVNEEHVPHMLQQQLLGQQDAPNTLCTPKGASERTRTLKFTGFYCTAMVAQAAYLLT
jgi:hypothetical protein